MSAPVRIVTAASLFDGHDAAINVMRRVLQASGAEVIHLGHDRAVQDIVECAIQEDAQAVAITSYQGGHVEFFKYMLDLFRERGADIAIFGGGGGTILPSEAAALHEYGVTRLYSPDDGRALGLQGMIDDLLGRLRVTLPDPSVFLPRLRASDALAVGKALTLAELAPEAVRALAAPAVRAPILGITGTGGAGKSSLTDELVRRFLLATAERRVAILSIDPTRRRSGGALLGDRIRMNSVVPGPLSRASDGSSRVFMRSLATRGASSLAAALPDALRVVAAAGFDLIIVETPGIGQSDSSIAELVDLSLYVMTHEYGAASQLEKIDMLDFADVVAINKSDKPGSLDALRDVRKQVLRNRKAFDKSPEAMPVYATVASEFADPGTDRLFAALMAGLAARVSGWCAPVSDGSAPQAAAARGAERQRAPLVPAERVRYLAEIADASDREDAWIGQQAAAVRTVQQLEGAQRLVNEPAIQRALTDASAAVEPVSARLVAEWPAVRERYSGDTYRYEVRGKVLEQPLRRNSLSGVAVPRVALPRYTDAGDILTWRLREGLPGEYPFTAGVFPLKRDGEDPARMFAGEGGAERTNRRFHYVSHGMPATRLSTAFDSVTLYGQEPALRPDIYGKVGNSGVSVATLDDAKKLYSGFDLCAPTCSVSMTINGPAPMILAFFLNAAIDQAVERHLRAAHGDEGAEALVAGWFAARGQERPRYGGPLPEGNDGLGLLLLGLTGDQLVDRGTYDRIAAETLSAVRGTVQADILKEDQAQNTCIFSTEFALRMQGDIQVWFAQHRVRNFYSVSISGYHIAEAGANPISQVAFTLANGFTFVEYFLSRGLHIDEFAPNLSFFFSNGMDPEYSVIGRVARRIWARAVKHRYGGNARSQQLKYHIQTSGRSLHAQEIAFNDIRTTLQALTALSDNCNSLHTNAYDEAITTPTEDSVRRALAIQLVIGKEHGLLTNENPLQGSFIIEELTDLVEKAVLDEFRRLSERGGVLGAMERMYQRTRIQEESLLYESKKHSGELPIIGVNTFKGRDGSPTVTPPEVIRSTTDEKDGAIVNLEAFKARNAAQAPAALARLQSAALAGENLFEALMETVKVASLGQISDALFAVGGRYRRSM